ncbi:hypothetical protein M9Y10_032677 [Tritrichomonas musculus]|uniref:Uncharacterized protein n=1 Tax=Tritrichomonas musculus TaxID=1915356 RepID=A0ABR2GYD9_9EUKA
MTRNKISDIDKYQRKDVKRFKEMMRYFDKNEIIPPEIYEIETMNAILYKIYNLNIHNQNNEIKNKFDKNYKNFSHKEYSSFEITLPTIHDIFVFKEETNEIHQIFDRYLRIDATVSYILRFSNFIISEYIENETPEDTSNIIEIKEKLIKIKENNEQMFDEILNEDRKDLNTDILSKATTNNEQIMLEISHTEEDSKAQPYINKEITLLNYLELKFNECQRRVGREKLRHVIRKIDVSQLTPDSLIAILRTLNKDIKYKIQLVNKPRMKMKKARKIVESFGFSTS